ncbi:EVE domain-containing protein [Bacillus infantis]|uniref:EVE domain-containing protein n=1 Tax=Bacillus infantis TaxID=324767 RepID=UPI0021557BF5|nr:EVE domain-containing protein [Bacillus infantis]MCR6610603.1 EVE domain-containing protein [Bacillus infantis]
MNTWIFQGNPNRFNINDYLRNEKTIYWSLRQEHYRKVITAGDTVYVWRADGGAKGSGGVVARGVVLGEPKSMVEPSQYWYEEPNDEEVLKVPITVSEQRVDGSYLNRLDLKDHEVLQSLRIHSIRNNTNYLLTDDQAEALEELWAATSPADIVYFPPLEPKKRSREYDSYSEELKLQVVYEYLFHGNTHRKPDSKISPEIEYVEIILSDNLTLVFEDLKGTQFKFIYDKKINGSFVLASRFTDDFIRGDIAHLAANAREKGLGNRTSPWSIYKVVEKSDFLRWYDTLPGPGSKENPHIQHHVFATSEIIYEILSEYEPKIEIIS